jgi:hypothetical protein
MALESRLRELDSKHRDLDERIEAESKSPACDWTSISDLKRQKLKLKEEIEALKARTTIH